MLAVRLLVVCAVVAFFGCAPTPPPETKPLPAALPDAGVPEPPKIEPPTESAAYKRAMASTIALLDSKAKSVICAGQFISPTVLVTAHHCIDTATGIAEDSGESYDGEPVAFVTRADLDPSSPMPISLGVIWRTAPDHDIALIVSVEPSLYWVELGTEPWPGSIVWAIGHPDRDYYRTSAGIVTTSLFPIGGRVTTAVIIYLDHGSSGGGLYNSDWQLVGVTSMGWLPITGFFIPAMYVRGLMAG